MFKLFRRKLNKKGFTLAELLVVVAIIAILVAVAIPIFTNALKDAQWRTNQANVRSVKAAAVTKILTTWSENDDGSKPMADGGKTDKSGWAATANIDAQGNVTNLKVYAQETLNGNWKDGVATTGTPYNGLFTDIDTGNDAFKIFSSSNGYTVRVIITSVDIKSST